jgi:transcriptional regulator with XRE-family HTH domain
MAPEEQHATEADSPQGNNGNGRALHRLAMVRRLQGISRRTVARRLNVEVADVRCQENPSFDLPISQLYQWQQALEVPVSELLVESEDALSQPLMRRAQLVRLMKTALAIREQVEVDDSMGVLAQTLIDQLVQVMPELSGISAWHAVGKRRRSSELGIAAQRSLSDDVFIDLSE